MLYIHTKNNLALTLVEVLVSIMILSILIVGTILLIDPRTVVNKGIDAQRKTDLNTIKKRLEEFYNDKGCYPKLSEICFSFGQNLAGTSCKVCGKENTSPSLNKYIETLPCDPFHPSNSYLYAIKSDADATEKSCPTAYSVYSKLSFHKDIDSVELGCDEGSCGPTGGYDYGVSSPNTTP